MHGDWRLRQLVAQPIRASCILYLWNSNHWTGRNGPSSKLDELVLASVLYI